MLLDASELFGDCSPGLAISFGEVEFLQFGFGFLKIAFGECFAGGLSVFGELQGFADFCEGLRVGWVLQLLLELLQRVFEVGEFGECFAGCAGVVSQF